MASYSVDGLRNKEYSKVALHELREEYEWETCLREAGLQTIFLSQNFSKLYCSEPVLLKCCQGGSVAVLVYVREKDMVCGLRYGGVITNCRNGSFCSEVATVLTHYFQAQGVVSWRIRNHPFMETINIGNLFDEEPFVFIELTNSRKDLVAAMSKQHRRHIERAVNSGLDVSYTSDPRYIKIFYDFYSTSLVQKGVKPRGCAFFDKMFALLRDHLTFAIVRKGNRILAVSLLLKDREDVFMIYGGMSEEGYRERAKHKMIFETIFNFKEKNFYRLVLGTGHNGEDSIYKFKRGFTGKEDVIRTYGL